MPPVLADYLGGIIRTVLAALLLPLVQKGLATASDTEQFVAAATGVILIAAWSLYQKYVAKQVQLVAQIMPPNSTEADVKDKIKTGVGVPSVLTAATDVPTPA